MSATNDGAAIADSRSHLTIVAELAEQTQLIQSLLAQARSEVLEVAVADNTQQGLTLAKFPVTGSRRVIAHRTGNGSDRFMVPQTPAWGLVLPVNEGRMGGLIVNAGPFPVILYLADQPRAGAPAAWLSPEGGAWNFQLGSVLWCGNVSASAQLGGPAQITVAEV